VRPVTVDAQRVPALIDSTGEVIELGESLPPISADAAGALLPRVRGALAAVRRLEGYLVSVLTGEMTARGQSERRVGDVVYALRSEGEWTVPDAGALHRVLVQAMTNSEITAHELEAACQQLVTFRFDHRALNLLAKRVPEIDQHRRRIEGEPRLRTK